MLQWMILPFKRYAEFSGRSRRMEYWSFTLLNIIVYAILVGILFAAAGGMGAFDPSGSALGPFSIFFGGLGFLVLIWWLIVLIPTLAVTVRRLHDRDMSGWWLLGFLVAYMIPFVNFVASIAFLVLMLLPGTSGPNTHGPDPKDPDSAQVFA